MTISSKDEVVLWFRQQTASLRVETLCSLLECCVPFEVRFVGTVLENLGRRDFHELRDAQHRANSFMSSASNLDESRLNLLASLMNDGSSVPTNGGISHPFPNSLRQHSPKLTATPVDQNNASTFMIRNQSVPTPDTQDPRPNRIAGEQKNWSTWVNEGSHPSSTITNHNKLSTGSSKSPNNVMIMNGLSPDTMGHNQLILTPVTDSSRISPGDSEEDIESSTTCIEKVLLNERVRHRMILYLALISATNKDGANTFFLLLTSQEIPQCGGYDRLTDHALAELSLLYTIGCYHPAFSFSQHTILLEILKQIRYCIHRRELMNGAHTYYSPYVNVEAKPANAYYYPIPAPVIMNSQFQQPPGSHPMQQQFVQVIHPPQGFQHTQLANPAVSAGSMHVQTTVNNATTPATSIDQAKPVDMSRIPNQPVLPYHYPSNYPVFMGQSPPTNNPVQPMTQPSAISNSGQKPPPTALEKRSLKVKERGEITMLNGYDSLLPQNDATQVNRSRNVSCFNCGAKTHFGQDCKELSMEEMTKHLYRLNYNASANAESS